MRLKNSETDLVGSQLSLAQIYQRLNTTPEEIVAFCQRWQLVEFALFGSILRDDFRSTGDNPSDVDVLFTYGANARKSLLLLVEMKYELEDLCDRNVDLVSKTALLQDHNHIRQGNILGSSRTIYGTR
ncbi:nucleotidyltransferase family protein [Roseofilum casamattae]|uniref:Nucleotidyltransferase domain-containing protein n=1 Tax=Roseofilum casamattae BLCC-M143 TaxID=3022442 RepID=A0ABT7C1I4_9CYAN|nr:nucleotidyltransferase domain-containing protein [Roseofilum casamattae]MDJ1185165.1 nucleotidyltransferase domain-containing protein [Roseofilum casamattae BLCC-M143]